MTHRLVSPMQNSPLNSKTLIQPPSPLPLAFLHDICNLVCLKHKLQISTLHKILLPLYSLIEGLFQPSRCSVKHLKSSLSLSPLHTLCSIIGKAYFFLSPKYIQTPDTPHPLHHHHPGPCGIVSCLAYYSSLSLRSLLPFLSPLQSILIPARERSFIWVFITPLSKALQWFHISTVEATVYNKACHESAPPHLFLQPHLPLNHSTGQPQQPPHEVPSTPDWLLP